MSDPRTAEHETPESRFQRLVRAGDRDGAARLLHENYAPELQRKLAKLALALGGGDEAEHLSNWAICRATLHGASFDPARGSLLGWLSFVARNLALSQLRKHKGSGPLPSDPEARERQVQSRIENNDAFWRAFQALPNALLKRVLFFDLLHHGQAPGHLAAGALGLDRATFYKRRSEARRELRRIWNEMFGGPGESFYRDLR